MTRRELEITDIVKIEEIIKKAKYLHLGLVDDGMPYIVPMNYGHIMEDGKLTLYLHSARKCYKMDVIHKNPVCCFELECDVEPFEGAKPCQNGMTYSSVMGRGEIREIEDPEERRLAMSILMKTQTDGDFEFTDRLLSAVSMLKIEVSEFTAKRRPHPSEREEMVNKQ
ncbi:MAG: pyridoxamine 5'-phosphate oxidase family protein [Firmicutes bacterium]|nr:pyridoxamine 5'-phosphate oxidase family protein [Bacillota bacterium]